MDERVTMIRVLKAHQTEALGAQLAVQSMLPSSVSDTLSRDGQMLEDQLEDVLSTSESHIQALQHVIDMVQADLNSDAVRSLAEAAKTNSRAE